MDRQIDEFIDYLRNVKKTSDNTLISYKRDLVRMKNYMDQRGITDPRDITEDKVLDYCSSLKEEHFAPSSISRHNTSIKNFFRYLLEIGVIEDNPAENIKSPKVTAKEPRVLNAVEIENILSQDFGDDVKGKRDKAILELMYATGLKASEVVNLKLSDVDLGLSCLRLKNRLIPYGKKAKEALIAYLTDARKELILDNSDDETVFLNCNGFPLSRQGLWKLVKVYVKKAGASSDITPFTLRHSFAVHLVDNGVDASSVQELMGYSDSNTISRYMSKNVRSKDPYEWARIRN